MAPLSEEARTQIRALPDRYEHHQSALVPALFVAQQETGYLSPEVLAEVAALLGLPLTEVTAVASFYRLFFLRPTGRHQILLCTNLACALSGSEAIRRHLETRLEIRAGETTPDGVFTLRTWECLAACDLAPMMMVDTERVGLLTADVVDGTLERYRGT